MEKNAFIFDTNKCVGCMACAAACIIENGTSIPLNWREVSSFNQIRHPDLALFHYSLACNHCEDAPCMKNCPAMAYSRDEETGAIIHHAESCIGCTYCTWACPYDAPKYNASRGIVEKCNFCVDRLHEGNSPACVEACPVGALNFGPEDISEEEYIQPGFSNTGIKPSIKIIPLRKENTKPTIHTKENIRIKDIPDEYKPLKKSSKIRLKKEWPLVIFSLIMASLTAWSAAGISHDIPVLPEFFIPIALIAITLTSVHVGKKFRIWRFVLHIRESWLSREIVFVSLFVGSAVVYQFLEFEWIKYFVIAFAILCLLSIDKVYEILRNAEKKQHSASVLTTGLFFYALLTNTDFLIGFCFAIKLGFYIRRKVIYRKNKQNFRPVTSLIRLILLIVGTFMHTFHPEFSVLWPILIIFVGEIIDRIEFYHEADVITPEKELAREYDEQIKMHS